MDCTGVGLAAVFKWNINTPDPVNPDVIRNKRMLNSRYRRKATMLVLLGAFAVAFATISARWQRNFDSPDRIAVHNPVSHEIDLAQDVATAKTGREHYQAGEYLLAAESFARTAELEPGDARHQNDAGHAFWKARDYANALVHLELAVSMSPTTLRFANNLATLYVDTGRDDEALSILMKSHQNTAHAHYNIGYLYLQRKRREEAIEQMTIALTHNPNLEVASRWLSRLTQENAPDELVDAYLSP